MVGGHFRLGNLAPVLLLCHAVLFDCDGVLVDSGPSVTSAWDRWARALELDPDAVNMVAHGRRSEETVALLVPEPRRTAELARIDRYELEDAGGIRALDGAGALVSSIPGQGWAVVTSGRGELARARLRAAGLPCPDVIVTADDVQRGKPDPEGYRLAAERLGVVAERTVVLEDAAVGIAAARAAGAGAVVGVGRRAEGAGADVVVPDLRWVRWTGDGLEIL